MDGLIEFVFFVVFVGACILFDKLNDVMKKASPQAEPTKPIVVEIPTQPTPSQPLKTKNIAKKKAKKIETTPSWHQTKDMSQRAEFQNEGIRSTQNIIQPIETQQHSEFEMNTPEDIRKAIVWSEVLKRKY